MRQLCLLLILFICLSNISKAQLISIVDSTNKYPTIENILKLDYFKDKVVYVDIWGTHCGPCLNEFKCLPELKSKYQNDSIVFLYLCTPYQMKWEDNKENVKLWTSLSQKYHLSGINIFMSAESYMDLFNNHDGSYSEDRKFGIPTYLLVDKKNFIVDFDAPRPSENEILNHSIDLLLNNSTLKKDSVYIAYKLKKHRNKR